MIRLFLVCCVWDGKTHTKGIGMEQEFKTYTMAIDMLAKLTPEEK